MRCREDDDLIILVHLFQKPDQVRSHSDLCFDIKAKGNRNTEIEVSLLVQVFVAVDHSFIKVQNQCFSDYLLFGQVNHFRFERLQRRHLKLRTLMDLS